MAIVHLGDPTPVVGLPFTRVQGSEPIQYEQLEGVVTLSKRALVSEAHSSHCLPYPSSMTATSGGTTFSRAASS